MLEKINFKTAYNKKDFKSDIKKLKSEIFALQQTIKENKLPVIILFEGWGASGKGFMINEIISSLDPRSFKVHSATSVDYSETRKPWLWKYWNKIPEYGRFSIFDRSWYKEVSTDRIEKNLSDKTVYGRIESINTFERQLTDDGYLILKFFLHITVDEQKERLKKLAASKSTSWRVTRQDITRNKNYSLYYNAFDEMFRLTDTSCAPWHIIDSMKKASAVHEIYKILISSIKNALEHTSAAVQNHMADSVIKEFKLLDMRELSKISLKKSLSSDEYDKNLIQEQKKLFKLHNKLYRNNTPLVIVFEGWDAAGKGGAIKRVASALDPRGYEAIPIAAPDKYELSHHYLWRFWKSLPKTGHIAIFDRSWYGRVMVERVEGLTKEVRWKQAYQEINEFEYELCKWGAIVIKFWLHIDKDEQLKRFTERQITPEKSWKITDEDWRNREKWDEYEAAVNEMVKLTSTPSAQWHIISTNDKRFARIKILKTINKTIEEYFDSKN